MLTQKLITTSYSFACSTASDVYESTYVENLESRGINNGPGKWQGSY